MSDLNLVVVAHPDDEILGFGATGAKYVSNKEAVQPIILSGGVDQRNKRPSDTELHDDITAANRTLGFNEPILGNFPNIKMNNVDHIQLVKFIEEQILEFKPKRIFTHHPSDLNNDHYHVSHACLAASRIYQRKVQESNIEGLYFMEVLSSTDWAYESVGNSFKATHFENIDDFIDLKIEALSCYRNVMRNEPHSRSEHVLKGLASYRGAQSGFKFAEAFQAVYTRN